MKFWRRWSGAWLAGGIVTAACAQPEVALRDAVKQLMNAGTYSWQESHAFNPQQAARSIPTGEGETEVGGFTTAIFQRRNVVLRGPEAALKMESGWRYAADLTDAEVEELGRLQMSGAARSSVLPSPIVEQRAQSSRQKTAKAERAHRYTHAVPHDVLQYVLREATNFRKVGGRIAADIASTREGRNDLQRYLLTGRMPESSTMSRAAEILGRATRRPPMLPEGERPTLYVSLSGGTIDEFSIEFNERVNLSVDGDPAVPSTVTFVYATKLFDIGHTTVVVEPEARALFLDAAGKP